jgi:hypothetical protein
LTRSALAHHRECAPDRLDIGPRENLLALDIQRDRFKGRDAVTTSDEFHAW